jgi:uncharacterized protein (TIGR03000 family)
MSPPRRVVFSLCALALTVVLTAGLGASQNPAAPQGGKTTLEIQLPKGKRARLEIDGNVIPGKGKAREVEAPPLAKGKKYWEVAAVWEPTNYEKFYRKRKVFPKPGQKVVVDLRDEDPKNKDELVIRFVPTPDDVVERMCKLGKVGKKDVVYDIGCGDGRMVIIAVADFGAKHGVGVDLDPQRIKESKENAEKRGLKQGKDGRVEFRVQDALKINDLSDATVVLLYMGEPMNLILRPILKKTLKPGARIVSHRFRMGDWKPDKEETFTAKDGDEYTILLWTITDKSASEEKKSDPPQGRPQAALLPPTLSRAPVR